jgi:hypothetical protein
MSGSMRGYWTEARAHVSGPLAVRYSRAGNVATPGARHADPDERARTAAQAWLAGRRVVGLLRTPEPHMHFSPSGLSFDDGPHVEEGELLLLEIGVPDEPQAWRATARVVGVARIPIDERDDGPGATHRIACAFDAVPPDAIEALRRYTRRIQETEDT